MDSNELDKIRAEGFHYIVQLWIVIEENERKFAERWREEMEKWPQDRTVVFRRPIPFSD